MRIAVIIPAGGVGARLGGRTPKQFLSLDGGPILVTTLRRFTRHPGVEAIVVAAPARYLARTRRLVAPLARPGRIAVVAGGPTRQESVWEALRTVPSATDIVVVHDAVRPLVTRRLVDAVVGAARAAGAAICAVPIAETVKRVRGDVVESTVDRAGLWAVQTPQAFRPGLLREAHERARLDAVVGTDDAMLVERLGRPVRVVHGSEANVKITTREDLRRVRRWVRR